MTARSRTRVDAFIEAISAFESPQVFNPWHDACGAHDRNPHAYLARRERLRAHLSAPRIDLVLIGEAPGYQGCRYSGMAFTSERLLLEGAIPRVPALKERITNLSTPASEPSATIVWGSLHEYGVAERTILWNAFAWHPMGDEPRSNRTPTTSERRAGIPVLEEFLKLIGGAPLIAVGRTAEKSLQDLEIQPHGTLRHPAMGGATEFRRGLLDLTQRLGLYDPPSPRLFSV